MKKIVSICLIFFLSYLSLAHKSVYGYGYAREEDPLIKVFKSVVFHGRQSNWSKVADEINTIRDRITDIYTIFRINLQPRIESAVQKQDFQTLANHMANLVFLAIREKFYYNRKERLEIFIRSKVRLRLAEEYYSTLLAGNVRNYDVRHKTNLHENIHNRFLRARDTLGSMGFLGAGAVKPNVKDFETITREIEAFLLQAFPYFEKGRVNE